MPESSRLGNTDPLGADHPGLDLLESIQTRVDQFLASRAPILAPLGEHPLTLLDYSQSFLRGGKRFRAQFCYWGWRAAQRDRSDLDGSGWHAIVTAATALEVFHAAALVHDDLIDHSDIRRGAPSAHRHFAGMPAPTWTGDAEEFGAAAAILLGDLLIVWSDELLDESLGTLAPRDAAAVRGEFNRMRTQVTAGQFLDILEERLPVDAPGNALDRAERVIVYKSAKYSIESPLALGALHAGASSEQLDTLRAYGLPLGIAYQLRDDLLGVFGDATVTGKPSGDDLREGKRTVLIALARRTMSDEDRSRLETMLGDPRLDAEGVATLQDAIRRSGAVERVEQLISERADEARAALENAPLAPAALEHLANLASIVTDRDA